MMQPEDIPFLTVGTEVSAKYKGAFCEAKVNKVVKNVKIKVNYKQGMGSAVLSDEDIKGVLKIGSTVKANHPDRNQYFDAIISKIQDCSQYTVVFDDGDITTLRRSSLCMKSGRHFAESETLDQLPLTHPEHFGTPVVGGRRGGRRSRHNPEDSDSSEEEDNVHKRHRSRREEWEADIGKVVCVELGDKKKQKDNWFPGLVVAPTAQDSVKIETKKDYLVRSFQDGRYYTVPKKEASPFSREIGSKVSQTTLRTAVDKALLYLDKDELPPHWDRDLLFGNDRVGSSSDPDASDTDSSDDEPREEKDHFVAQLYKFMEECGTPINKGPTIGNRDLDLYKLFKVVQKLGGFNRVVNNNQWKIVSGKMGLQLLGSQSPTLVKSAYKRYLHNFEDFYRKLGCTMVSNPRGSRTRHKSGRSLIRDCDKAPRELKGKKDESSEENEEGEKKEEEPNKIITRKREGGSADSKSSEPEIKPRVVKLEGPSSPSVDQSSSSYDSLVIGTVIVPHSNIRDKPRTPRATERRKDIVIDVKTRSSAREVKKPDEEFISQASQQHPTQSSSQQQQSTSDKEQEVEITQTRSLRNREDSIKKEDVKDTKEDVSVKKVLPVVTRKAKSEAAPERSASSSSNSSSTSGTTQPAVVDNKITVVKTKVKVKGVTPPTILTSDNSDDGLGVKKRGRKKKPEEVEVGDSIPAHVPVAAGDRLQVLYGPSPRESKVTYEAKVLEVKDEETDGTQYYVHYLGWNTRHDEWIPRSSIATNLTWAQNRTKKGRAAVTKEIKEKEKEKKDDKKKDEKDDKKTKTNAPKTIQTPGKRGRSGGRERHESEKSDTGSVTTTRSSSRAEKGTRPDSPVVVDLRRSKRNTCAMSDASDSEDYESEDGDSCSEKERSLEHRGASSVSSSSPSTLTPEPMIDPKFIKTEPVDKISEDAMSCGKDIDLKAIESEMKGLDRPIKKEDEKCCKEMPRIVSLTVPPALAGLKPNGTDVLVKRIGSESPLKKVEIQIKAVHPNESIIKQIKRENKGFDIYEFKEPEPFEFGEIRRKDGKSKNTGNYSDDGDQEVVKVRKKGKIKRDLKDDAEKSESDSDSSISPPKRFSPSQETPIKKEDPSDNFPSPDKIENSPGSSKKVIIPKKDLTKQLTTPEKVQKIVSDAAKSPIIKCPSADTGKPDIIPRDQLNLSPSPIRFKSDSGPPPTNIRPLGINVRTITNQIRHQLSSVPPARLIGPISFSPNKIPSTAQPLTIRTKSPHPITYPGPHQRNLSTPVIATTLPSLSPVQVSSQASIDLVTSKPNTQLVVTQIPTTTSFINSVPQQLRVSPTTAVVHNFGSKSKYISQTTTSTRPTQTITVRPALAFSQSGSQVKLNVAMQSPISSTASTIQSDLKTLSTSPNNPSTHTPPTAGQQNPVIHLLAQVVVQPKESKALAKAKVNPSLVDKVTKNVDDKNDGRVIPFSQRQQQIFPHLLNRPESGEKVKEIPPPKVVEPINEVPEEVSIPETAIVHNPETERLLQEASVEESIEAVVQRAREDQLEEPESKSESKSSERKRRSSNRIKKVLSPEFIPDTSEESDSDCKQTTSDCEKTKNPREIEIKARRRTKSNSESEKSIQRRKSTDDQADPEKESISGQKETNEPVLKRESESLEKESKLPRKKLRTGPNVKSRVDEEVESGLGDLLCEETIPPGSPMAQDNSTNDAESQTKSAIKHEMPFASVPTGSNYTKRGSEQPILPCHSQYQSPVVPEVSSTSFQVSESNTSSSSAKPEVVPVNVIKTEAGIPSVIAKKEKTPEVAENKPIEPKPKSSAAGNTVMDNTPPTTPESVASLSDSPSRREESTASKSGRESSEAEDCLQDRHKPDQFSEDSNTMDSNNSADPPTRGRGRPAGCKRQSAPVLEGENWDEDGNNSTSSNTNKRRKRGPRARANEDEDDNSNARKSHHSRRHRRRSPSRNKEEECDNSGLATLSFAACGGSGKSKYNFCTELDPSLDSDRRIQVLQSRMHEVRKIYVKIKSELAYVERRRKKLRKREKEREKNENS